MEFTVRPKTGLRKGDVTGNDTQRRFLAQHSTALQCWNNVASIRISITTMLKRCVALKIVVANRLV